MFDLPATAKRSDVESDDDMTTLLFRIELRLALPYGASATQSRTHPQLSTLSHAVFNASGQDKGV